MTKTIVVSDQVHKELFARKKHSRDTIDLILRSILQLEEKKEPAVAEVEKPLTQNTEVQA